MSQPSLRMRVLPRFPAKVSATDGIVAERDGPDVVVKSDYGSLVAVPSVTNPDKLMFKTWDRDLNLYTTVSFTNILSNVQDAVIGPPLSAIDAVNPGADQVVYFTGEGEAASFTASNFVRSVSNAVDARSYLTSIGALPSKGILKASVYCAGDGSNEDTAFSAFIAAANAASSDLEINIPISLEAIATITNLAGRRLLFTGSGKLVFTGTVGGLVIDNTGITTGYACAAIVKDPKIYTTHDGGGVGFTFLGSQYLADIDVASIVIENPIIEGISASTGWSKSMLIDKAIASRIMRPKIKGRATLAAGCMSYGIELRNGCNQVDIYSPTIDWALYGVVTTADNPAYAPVEGIRVIGGEIRACRNGFVTTAPGQQHKSIGVHYDTTQIGIQFGIDNVGGSDFSSAIGNFLLRSSAESWTGSNYVAILQNANFPAHSGNIIWLDATVVGGVSRQNNSFGIVAGSISDASKIVRGTIVNNVVSGCNYPILLYNTTIGVIAKGNILDAFGNSGMFLGVNDLGTGNDPLDNLVVNSAGVVSSPLDTKYVRYTGPLTDGGSNLGASGNRFGTLFAKLATLGGNAETVVTSALNGAAASTRRLQWQTAGLGRWDMTTSTAAETGSNAGADLQVISRTDAGNNNGAALTITRANNVVAFGAATKPAAFTVATLPAAASFAGCFCYASNARVFNGAGVQEGSGAGTGSLVQSNGTVWRIAGTNVTAIA